MQTLTLEITDSSAMPALKALVSKKAIKIISKDEMHSPALPGEPFSLYALKQWISNAESAPSMSLKQARSQWANRRKQLQRIGK